MLIVSYTSEVLKKYEKKLWLLTGFIALQILLGAAVVLTKLQYAVTALHLTVALLIFATSLYAWFQGMKESSV